MAGPGTTATWRADAHVEPDATGATTVAGTADANILESIEEGTAEVRGRGLRVPTGTPKCTLRWVRPVRGAGSRSAATPCAQRCRPGSTSCGLAPKGLASVSAICQ